MEEWTICALKGDKKSVAAAMPEFKEACLSIMGKGTGKLPACITCGFAEFITKIAGCVKPPSIEIKNRAAPGDPPLHIQKKKRKAGDVPAGDADDLPLNKLQKQVLPYSGKKRGPKSKAEKALAAMETAKLPRTFFDFRDMMEANATGGFPYTPPLQLIYGLRESLNMLFEEGLENVYTRHTRLAEGVRRATRAWGLELVAQSPDLYSDTVSAIYVPEGFDSNELTDHAFSSYGVSFGIGLGEMNGRAFRIGHLGSLTDVMVLSGLATIEMAMADLDYPIELGSGVAAAQEHFRCPVPAITKAAA